MFKLGNYQNSENIISKATGITFAAFLDTAQKIADSASKSKGLAISSLLLTLQGLTIFSAFLKTPQNLKIRRAKVSKRTKVFDSAEFNCVPLSIHSSYIRSTGSLKEMPFRRPAFYPTATLYSEMPFPTCTFYCRCPFKDPPFYLIYTFYYRCLLKYPPFLSNIHFPLQMPFQRSTFLSDPSPIIGNACSDSVTHSLTPV